jgi:MFS family permease
MATVTSTVRLDEAGLAPYLAPRHDLVLESDAADTSVDHIHVFLLEQGPFRSYERRVEWHPSAVPGHVELTQRTEFRWAVPFWWFLFHWPMKRRLRRPGGSAPWWAPPHPLDATGALVLGLMCTVSVVAGYLGTVITQTITFASDEFHQSSGTQGAVLALTRTGVVFTLLALSLADRKGRRYVTIVGTLLACLFTVAGAASPDIWIHGATQTVARGVTTAVGLLVVVIVAEELPAGARAYGVSLLALCAGLGAGMAVWVLPVADLNEKGWRLVYVLPIVGVPLSIYLARRLPETRRFAAQITPAGGTTRPSMRGSRLALLALTSFLVLLYRAPASQLQNDFLKKERGFSAKRISLFTVVTSTPIGLGVVAGGRLSDARGRRVVAAIGLIAGTVGTTLAFLAHGWPLWAWQFAGLVIGAMTIPALGTYGPEMFATRSRGRANGILAFAGTAGSSVGLIVAGALSDHVGLGKALLLLSIGPLAVALLVMAKFPETAHLELEELNPEDAPLPS